MTATFTTILDGLEVTMRLGVHADEVARPQRVRLSVWMEADYGPSAPADRIEEVVDYDFIRLGIHDLARRHFAFVPARSARAIGPGPLDQARHLPRRRDRLRDRANRERLNAMAKQVVPFKRRSVPRR